ncbi:MAG: hypothetical protein IPK95_12385 [Cellvibrionales bacterium]|nr:hypothetical protein [Cellvibrionales bacterium]
MGPFHLLLWRKFSFNRNCFSAGFVRYCSWRKNKLAKRTTKIFYQDELLSKTETNAKKNFLAQISHELRTPLAGIIGLADLAKKNTLYSTNKTLIDGINESAKHLLDTTNTLLDHARLDAGKWPVTKETFSPTSLIKESIANCREKFHRKTY